MTMEEKGGVVSERAGDVRDRGGGKEMKGDERCCRSEWDKRKIWEKNGKE